MSSSIGSVPPPNPLSYAGSVFVQFIMRRFPPQDTFNTFQVGTIWLDTLASNAYILVSKELGVADWILIGGEPGELATITTPDSTVIVPDAGNINFLNGTGMNITGSADNITFNIADSVANLYTADSGIATPSSSNLNILGGSTGLTTLGFDSTISLTGTLLVTHGGTGFASTTAYGVITGGTTSTGTLQNSGTGATGQLLVSNGASALPTWQSFRINVQTLTASGTYTPTPGMQQCIVELIGGGGGSGGVAAGGANYSATGGGGTGAYSRGAFSAATIGASRPVTIGVGGSGGAIGFNPGGNGGDSSFDNLMTAPGGFGSSGGNSTNDSQLVPGGSGASAGTGGQLNVGGQKGYFGTIFTTSTTAPAIGGEGGDTIYGAGGTIGIPGSGQDGPGSNGTGFGSGGGGASSFRGPSGAPGGNGASGVLIVTEYIL